MSMRALTGMLALTLMSSTIPAKDATTSKSLFEPCSDVVTQAEIRSLRDDPITKNLESAGCLRLTNKEFVVFTGDAILESPFRYCAAGRTPACEAEPFRPYAFIVVQEFTGANRKRFMLWRTYRYRLGVYSHAFGIVSLVPRSIEPRGFGVYTLVSGRIFHGEQSSTSDPCQDLGDEVNEIMGYELAGEGTADVELRFNERIVNCKTREETVSVRRYRPRNGVFELVP